jgi:hypothetical protein
VRPNPEAKAIIPILIVARDLMVAPSPRHPARQTQPPIKNKFQKCRRKLSVSNRPVKSLARRNDQKNIANIISSPTATSSENSPLRTRHVLVIELIKAHANRRPKFYESACRHVVFPDSGKTVSQALSGKNNLAVHINTHNSLSPTTSYGARVNSKHQVAHNSVFPESALLATRKRIRRRHHFGPRESRGPCPTNVGFAPTVHCRVR